MSSMVVRKFMTAWSVWSKRWTDPRMAPYQAPVFLLDQGRAGVVVGPYLSERWELRDEFVRYASMESAARELNLRASDFAPARAWSEELPAMMGRTRPLLAAALERARVGDVPGYCEKALAFVRDLCAVLNEAKVKPTLSDEYRAKLADRDRRVEANALAVLAKVAGEGGGPTS